MDRHEKKYSNTDKKIHRAFLRLLARREFSEISVTAVCKMAGVNRSTFYSHYANTHELAERIQSSIIEIFIDEMLKKGVLTPKDLHGRQRAITAEEQKATITEFLEFIKKHKVIYSVVIKNRQYFSFEQNKRQFKDEVFFPCFESHNLTDETAKEYLFEFLFSGAFAVVDKWVAEGCHADVAEIGEILFGIFKRNFVIR